MGCIIFESKKTMYACYNIYINSEFMYFHMLADTDVDGYGYEHAMPQQK